MPKNTRFGVLVLIIVTVFFIVFYAILNYIPTTKNYDDIMRRATTDNPAAVAFTLGYSERRKFYKNVYRDSKTGLAVVKNEKYPVDINGKLKVLDSTHGIVSDRDDGNGFSVSGMEMIKFTCPSGYSNRNCIIKPLCDGENDTGKYKLIDYIHFNELYRRHSLQQFTSNSLDVQQRQQSPPQQHNYHPRLRALCKSDGTYELEACAENKLINIDTVQCEIYDVCSEHGNGFTHRHEINNDTKNLADNEYYLCQNGKSKLQRCAPGTLYSSVHRSCINSPRCLESNTETIQIDNNNYLFCKDGNERLVSCDLGVITIDNTLTCRQPTCVEKIDTFDDGILHFNTGAVVCDKSTDKATTIKCDTTPVPQSRRGHWLDDFVAFTYENWPKQVYSSEMRQCIKTPENLNLIVKPDAHMSVQWSKLMSEGHTFSVTRDHIYKCDTKYRWDYMREMLVPNDLPIPSETQQRLFVDTAKPCQNEAIPNDKMPWQGCELANQYPEYEPHGVFAVEIDQTDYTYFWPYYDLAEDVYGGAIAYYEDRNLIIDYFETSRPPIGFYGYGENGSESGETFDTFKIRLRLKGVSETFYTSIVDKYDTRVWYFIATGKTDRLQFPYDNNNTAPTSVSRLTTHCPTKVNTSTLTTLLSLPILWNNIENYDQKFTILPNDMLYITKNGVYSNGVRAPPSYKLLTINREVLDTTNIVELTFSYGNSIRVIHNNDVEFSMP